MPVLKSREEIRAGNVQGTAFTLLHNACQPPPFSLPSSGQACGLSFFLTSSSFSSSSFPCGGPLIPPFLLSTPANPACPLALRLSAPLLCTPIARLRVSETWGSWIRAWRFPRGPRRSERGQHTARSCHSSSVLSRIPSASTNQPQIDKFTQYCRHPSGQL